MSGRTLTARQLKFCLLIVEGSTNAKAYAKAGYKCHNRMVTEVNASRLLNSAKIQAKIAELRLPAARNAQITVEKLTARLLEIDKAATADGQHAAATAALALVARLNGLITDHKTVDIVHHKPARSPVLKDLELSEDDWLRLYKPKD
jgi:phage terminase small subunit